MRIRINWKKTLLIIGDLALATYLALAFGKYNQPDTSSVACEKVGIVITDQSQNGFLDKNDVKNILLKKGLYPEGKKIDQVEPRSIEVALKQNALIYDVECYKTPKGFVGINVSQRLPVMRIKSEGGTDCYIDAAGNEMRNSHYTSDLIVATGYIDRAYAHDYLSLVGNYMLDNELWNKQIEQINIRQDKSLEIVPRIGDHVVCLGALPESADSLKRIKNVNDFLDRKLTRLSKFYRYGLNLSGWNKYDYINLEFDNQIICRKRHTRNNIPS